jgi:transposase
VITRVRAHEKTEIRILRNKKCKNRFEQAFKSADILNNISTIILKHRFNSEMHKEAKKYIIVTGATECVVADLVDISKNTATKFYNNLRQIIAKNIKNKTVFAGEVKINKSYFSGKRKRKRNRSAAEKVLVFCLLKRNGKVIKDMKNQTLILIIDKKVVPDSIVYTNTYKSYNALNISQFQHY